MEETNWKERIRRAFRFLTNNRTRKGARITYGVFWNFFLLICITGFTGVAFAGGVGAGYFASLVKDEPIRSSDDMKKDVYNLEATTEIFFAENVYMGKLRSDIEREEVTLDQVSPYVKDAIISTEDQYFYEHEGVVPKAILRAVYQEFSNANVQTGGSTLTQQLIKNQILTNEVSFERKAKEILLALRLEQFLNKDEILEAYLNMSSFGRSSSGRNIAGVQTAAQGIFGVDALDLTLPQAAFIAGLPQSPYAYTPFTQTGEVKENLEPGMERMHTVLERMLDNGKIDEKEYEAAISYDLTKDFAPPQPSTTEAYPFLAYEIEKQAIDILKIQIAEEDGYNKEDLESDEILNEEYRLLADRNLRQNGYRIRTTIDKEIYDRMQEVTKNYKNYAYNTSFTYEDSETGEIVTEEQPIETGGVLIENATGKIISFVAGRNFDREQLNHAFRSERQNGSTMKPLVVYGPAIEEGIASPGTVIPDVYTEYQAGPELWTPSNYVSNSYRGLTTTRYALQQSLNIPAARLYWEMSSLQPANYLPKMGFTSLTEGDFSNLALALGGMEIGVSVEENTNAYTTFANGGEFIDAYMIQSIETAEGDSVYEHEIKREKVFSPQTAYLLIDMMRDVVNQGTAASLPRLLSFQSDWAGKTGTSQNTNDTWFVASNPSVTFGTWMGYDQPQTIQSIPGYSYNQQNLGLWAQLINAAYEIDPERISTGDRFKMPGGIVRRSYCAVSGELPSDACLQAGLVETDLFSANNVPTTTDDNLSNAGFVRIGEETYIANERTPAEFVESGIVLTPEFIDNQIGGEILRPEEELIPSDSRWEQLLIPDNVLEENGKAPDPLRITQQGSTLRWSTHPEEDVVGYYVYNVTDSAETRVDALANTQSGYSVNVGDGSYAVRAVDITGQLSPLSNVMQIGEPPTPEPDDNNNDDENSGENQGEEENPPNDGSNEDRPPDDQENDPNDGNGDAPPPSDGNNNGNG